MLQIQLNYLFPVFLLSILISSITSQEIEGPREQLDPKDERVNGALASATPSIRSWMEKKEHPDAYYRPQFPISAQGQLTPKGYNYWITFQLDQYNSTDNQFIDFRIFEAKIFKPKDTFFFRLRELGPVTK